MARIKVSKASKPVLNWLVTQCEMMRPDYRDRGRVGYGMPMPNYSTDWAQGGPIIDREKISCHPAYISGATESGAEVAVSNGWVCFHTTRLFWQKVRFRQAGATLLIAAMRCLVASKLGDEVEVPDELIGA